MKGEQNLEKYLSRNVKLRDGLCVKLTGVNGIPDRLVLTNTGRHFFVELKTDGGRVSQIQDSIHKRLRHMGHEVYVVWDYKQVDMILYYYFGE